MQLRQSAQEEESWLDNSAEDRRQSSTGCRTIKSLNDVTPSESWAHEQGTKTHNQLTAVGALAKPRRRKSLKAPVCPVESEIEKPPM
jgi:hypothetical protein